MATPWANASAQVAAHSIKADVLAPAVVVAFAVSRILLRPSGAPAIFRQAPAVSPLKAMLQQSK
jgi:hypothetical protein